MVARRWGFAAFMAVAPSTVPVGRLDPASPPALMLVVGDPVVSLAAFRISRAPRPADRMDVGVSLVDPKLASSELTASLSRRRGSVSPLSGPTSRRAREAFVTLTGWGHATANGPARHRVCPIYNSPPLTAAMAAATLAESVGRGRVVLGIGAGHPVIGRQFGNDRLSGVAGVEEYLTVVKSLLAGETVEHHGEHIHLDGARLALSTAVEMPVVLAALGPRMLGLAARSADGVLLNWSGPDALAATAQALREWREMVLSGSRPMFALPAIPTAPGEGGSGRRTGLLPAPPRLPGPFGETGVRPFGSGPGVGRDRRQSGPGA